MIISNQITNCFSNIDYELTAVVTCLMCLLLGVLSALYIIIQNLSSKELVFAFGALAGSFIFFGTQLFYELRSSKLPDKSFGVEYTVDRLTSLILPTISGSDRKFTLYGIKDAIELQASKWLLKTNPNILKQDNNCMQIAKDLAIFSLVNYLMHAKYDWQLEVDKISDKSGAIFFQSHSNSNASNSILYSWNDIRKILKKSDNIFADAPFVESIHKNVYLPPKTKINITKDEVIITNPVCEICFNCSWFGAHAGELSDLSKTKRLPNGEFQHFHHKVILKAKVKFFALRARHKDLEKYQLWINSLINDLPEWFSPAK